MLNYRDWVDQERRETYRRQQDERRFRGWRNKDGANDASRDEEDVTRVRCYIRQLHGSYWLNGENHRYQRLDVYVVLRGFWATGRQMRIVATIPLIDGFVESNCFLEYTFGATIVQKECGQYGDFPVYKYSLFYINHHGQCELIKVGEDVSVAWHRFRWKVEKEIEEQVKILFRRLYGIRRKRELSVYVCSDMNFFPAEAI